MRQDEVQNVKTNLLSVVCKDVAIKRRLIPVTGENFILSSATPLSFGTNVSMTKECQSFHKILEKKLSVKQNNTYSETL